MCGDRPHTVPRGVVEALIEVTDACGILQLGSKLRSGWAVCLMAGPFAEQIAINKLDDPGRVRVLLHILGRQVAASTDFNHLLRCSKSNRSRAAADAAGWSGARWPWYFPQICTLADLALKPPFGHNHG